MPRTDSFAHANMQRRLRTVALRLMKQADALLPPVTDMDRRNVALMQRAMADMVTEVFGDTAGQA